MISRFIKNHRFNKKTIRRLCSSEITNSQKYVFDRDLKLRQKQWSYYIDGSDYYDYLRKEATDRLADRLDDITRTFPLALEIGSHRHYFLEILKNSIAERNGHTIGGIRSLIQSDRFALPPPNIQDIDPSILNVMQLTCDDENLPFPKESFDLIINPFSLHWNNDLPKVFTDIKSILKQDGVFLGCMLGGETLEQLRYCFYLAEAERNGGYSPHASPFAKASDIAGLMQGAGFSLPTIDIDTVEIGYPDAFTLMEHLQKMGENNATFNRQFHTGKDTFLSMASLYQDLYGLEDGTISASFQMIFIIGWSPHESQQRPCQRGTATHSMKDVSNS